MCIYVQYELNPNDDNLIQFPIQEDRVELAWGRAYVSIGAPILIFRKGAGWIIALG